uniref:Uncharacterized protein n=1 Tax=Oryza meridionalis TaxID=40149 RepID=A0A0E0CJD1_9ORYZ
MTYVMDAYIQCLRDKEKGIRGDGKAFVEQAIKTGLLNVEGAHVESNNPRDKLGLEIWLATNYYLTW